MRRVADRRHQATTRTGVTASSPTAMLGLLLTHHFCDDDGKLLRRTSMDLNIGGLRVLVTAGAGGIGREIALAFAEEGARVHVCDVDTEALAELARAAPAIGRSVADVGDR